MPARRGRRLAALRLHRAALAWEKHREMSGGAGVSHPPRPAAAGKGGAWVEDARRAGGRLVVRRPGRLRAASATNWRLAPTSRMEDRKRNRVGVNCTPRRKTNEYGHVFFIHMH